MYAISSSKRLISGTTTIIQNVELSAMLTGEYQETEILVCPTQAISVSENLIDNCKCIACGVCKKLFPNIIEYRPETGDKLKFIDYCKSHKMFVYRWLSLTIDELSGMEVFIEGFSRSKRIPFVSVRGNVVNLVKCASSIKEVERVSADLDDMMLLAANAVAVSRLRKSIVIIQETTSQKEKDYLSSFQRSSIVELNNLYNDLISDIV